MTTENYEPTPIELAASIVSRNGRASYHGKLHHVSVRLQTHNYLHIQAMAESAGLTRSDMINRVLEAGIFAIRGELTEEGEKNFDVALRRVTGELMDEFSKEDQQ